MTRLAMNMAAAVLLALTPATVLAGDTEQAGKLFMEGNELRLAGKYKEALGKYNAAYKLLPSFKIEYNTALVLEKMGNLPAAHMVYKSFLKSGAGKSPEKILRTAREKVAARRKKIALVKVTSSVAGATVKVNGINVGKTPLPGDWEMGVKAPMSCGVWVEAEGYQTFTKSLILKVGQTITVEAVLKPVPKPAPVQPVTKLPENAPEPAAAVTGSDADCELDYQYSQKRRSKTIWAWTTLGVGLACAAGAGVLYGVGSSQVSSAYDEYRALDASYTDESFDNKWADVESAANLYIGGHVLAGVAAAGVGFSIYMFMTRQAAEREVAASTGGWHLGITAGDRQTGFVVSGGF